MPQVAVAWLAGPWTITTEHFGTVNIGAGILSELLVAFAAKALKIIPDAMRKAPWGVGLASGPSLPSSPPRSKAGSPSPWVSAPSSTSWAT